MIYFFIFVNKKKRDLNKQKKRKETKNICNLSSSLPYVASVLNKNTKENKCPPSNPDYLGGVTYLVSTKSPNKGRAPPKTTPTFISVDAYKTELQKWKQKQNKQPENKITKQDKARQDKKTE